MIERCLSIALVCWFGVSIVGCAEEDPIDARLKEIGYTPEKLVAELESRLKSMDESARQADAKGAGASGDTDSRGDGPGGGRNPFTFDSIMEDIQSKLLELQRKAGEGEDVTAQFLEKLDASEIDDDIKTKVVQFLQ